MKVDPLYFFVDAKSGCGERVEVGDCVTTTTSTANIDREILFIQILELGRLNSDAMQLQQVSCIQPGNTKYV